jgi:hypothetical protein
MGGGDQGLANFMADFAAGGISGAVAKTATAPIERVKLIIQTQDANPRIKSGEVPATLVSQTASPECTRSRALAPSGEVTSLT